MKTKIKNAGFFLILLLSAFSFPSIALCQDQLEESTSTKIEVRADGSATWTIERRFLLKTEEDVSIFEQYITEFEAQKEAYLEEFSNKTRELVDRASVITGRSMRAENFQITIDVLQTATASYGVITYRYDWVGFAKVEAKRITIGDVFEGGFYLYQEDALTIEHPSGYVVIAVSPTPDDTRKSDRTLTWYGRRNFGAGEPTVILEKETSSILDILQDHLPLTVGLLAIAGGGFTGLYLFKRKKKKKGDIKSSLVQATFEKMEDDEEKVIRLLESAGGQLFQSLIAKHCGFSSSKTSELLTTMENKGIVARRTKGREKLVTLIERDVKQDK
jgi:DNA-binding MarR family transcriptional regulator